MSFLNGHVNTLLTKKTNSARRLQKPHQVRGTPSEAPDGQRLEHDPALSSARIQEAKGGLERLLTGTALGTGDGGSQPQAPTAGPERGCAGGSISPRAAEPALPQPRPRSRHSAAGRARPLPAHPAPSGARDRGRRRGLLPPPPHLPRRWDLPGRGARAARTCPHQQCAFPAIRAKGHGAELSPLTLRPAGRAAPATPLPLPQSLALEAAILARAARPPPRRSRRAARGRHGTRSPDVFRAAAPYPAALTHSLPPSFLPSYPRPLPCPALPCSAGNRHGSVRRRRAAGVQSARRAPLARRLRGVSDRCAPARASPGRGRRVEQLKSRSTLFNCAHYLRDCKSHVKMPH